MNSQLKKQELLAIELGKILSLHKLRAVSAESCTGGLVSAAITAIAGSSTWFERGFVTYTNIAKHELLGVDLKTLNEFGAVSEAVVLEMAQGALKNSHADIAVAISGIAGPSGADATNSVGTVWLAWALSTGSVLTKKCHFLGDRHQVRQLAVIESLQGLCSLAQS